MTPRTRDPNSILPAAVAALPVLFCLENVSESVFWAALIGAAVLLSAAILFLFQRFISEKIRIFFILFVLALVTESLFLAASAFWTAGEEVMQTMPLAFVSAFLFFQRLPTPSSRAVLGWAGRLACFSGLVMLAGLLRQLGFGVFLPAAIFVAPALVQALDYRIKLSQVMQMSRFLWLFYFSIFVLTRAAYILCVWTSALFYVIPLVLIVILPFIQFVQSWRIRFGKRAGAVPDFYILFGVWMAMIWLARGSSEDFLGDLTGSFFASFVFAAVMAIKVRIETADLPNWLRPAPVLFLSAGLLMIGLSKFSRWLNW